jgi:F-type H+-transporting ATPase subunit delta
VESRIAKKYATALFRLAHERKIEETVWSDLSALAEVFRVDRRLLKVIAAPQIPDEDKHQLVRAVLSGAHEAVLNFMLFVIDKGRTEHIPRMIEIYGQLLDEERGIVEAEITSAVTLNEAEIGRIVQRLERLSGKKVRHRIQVDAEILGGVVVIIGGEIIDHSVRHDLYRLRDSLQALKVHEAA